MSDGVVMCAVAYDPKVVTIWEGFRAWFRERDFDFDFVLYSNYERQVEDLLSGNIHAAWNSPLAWVRARRLGAARGVDVRALSMRDTDQDLTSVILARSDTGISDVRDRSRTSAEWGSNPARPLTSSASMLGSGCTAIMSVVSARPPGRLSPVTSTRHA